jgi:two-component system, NarL family, sensor kinase
MTKETEPSALQELFEGFPRGIVLLELTDPADVSTWRLIAINRQAASLVAPSIETFVSGAALHLGPHVDLPNLYREIIRHRRAKTIGMAEAGAEDRGGPLANQRRLYMISAFPADARSVGLLFEDAHSFIKGRSARAEAERQLAQTCEFVGAILWRADPETLEFSYVSPQAQTILGYWLERWTGETNFWKKHLFPEDQEKVASACEKILRERKRGDFEFRMMSVHGQVLWFHAAAETAQGPGGRPELVGVMNDITDLKRAEERIRALTSRLMRLQDDERRHISRELHDSLGQYLTSIKINLELIRREGTTIEERHRAVLMESSETLEKCVQEVRSVSYLLHPPLLDELGLQAALRWYTAGFAERSGIEVNLSVPREFSRLPEEMELALFRIVQESLTNVQRHSGSQAAWVTLAEHKDSTEIRITDSGIGIPAETIERIRDGKTIEGVGLQGMYERVRELGGKLEIESGGMGTAVSAVLPLKYAQGKATKTAEEEDGRRSRIAGKPLESSDVRIEGTGRRDSGHKRAESELALESTGSRRRRASRRQT